MHIKYTARFEHQYRKLPRKVKQAAEQKEVLFRKDPQDPRLKTHKLKGPLKHFWSFSVTRKHRVLFEFINKDVVLFHDIGDHRVYQ